MISTRGVTRMAVVAAMVSVLPAMARGSLVSVVDGNGSISCGANVDSDLRRYNGDIPPDNPQVTLGAPFTDEHVVSVDHPSCQAAGSASQTSHFSDDIFYLSGAAAGTSSGYDPECGWNGYGYGYSGRSFSFTVNQPVRYYLTGELALSTNFVPYGNLGWVRCFLGTYSMTIYKCISYEAEGSVPFSQPISLMGVLQPGTYLLEVEGWVQAADYSPYYAPMGATTSFNVTLQLLPVPEPATMSLLALGGLGMLMRRRAARR